VKLPSATGANECWDAHSRFLRASAGKDVFVKAVVGPETNIDDIRRCAELVSAVDAAVPLVIQPATGPRPVPAALLLDLQAVALEQLEDVRVIPQCHKALGLL